MVTLVRAPNPSPMTLSGTNSYLVDCGGGAALAIDPGPPIAAHVDAILETAGARGLTIAAIVVTHGHPDHAPAAAPLAARCGAPVYAHPAGTVARDRDLPLNAPLNVGEATFDVVDAPGHTFDHVVLQLRDARALFTGDVILGEGTVLVAPPHGAMRPYQQTLRRLAQDFSGARTIYGGHGPVVRDAQAKIAEYIAHREMREREIVGALAERGGRTIPELVQRIYGNEHPELHPAMARQLLAHLIALESEGRVAAQRLDREMTAAESATLNPELEKLVGPEQAGVVAAELGAAMRVTDLYAYRLI